MLAHVSRPEAALADARETVASCHSYIVIRVGIKRPLLTTLMYRGEFVIHSSAINYQDLTDQELASEVSEQNREALAALYDRYGRRVFGMAARLLGDTVSSEEVTQDVFMRVWNRASSYAPEKGKFTTWLFRIAHNRAIDEMRKKGRDRNRQADDIADHWDLESTDPSPPDVAVANSEYASVRAALAKLPDPQRQVVELSYFKGMTQSEIADKTGQPLGTVKTRMRLALRKLHTALEPEIYGDL